jgi:hypothetical protein
METPAAMCQLSVSQPGLRKIPRTSRVYRDVETFLQTAHNFKKSVYTVIEVDWHESPKVIYYDPLDKKPFQCKTACVVFQFPKLALEKFQLWIESKEKEGLIDFMSVCLGVEDQKGLSKLIQKISRVKTMGKCSTTIEPNTIYMICMGELLMKTKEYKIHLTRHSIIYK